MRLPTSLGGDALVCAVLFCHARTVHVGRRALLLRARALYCRELMSTTHVRCYGDFCLGESPGVAVASGVSMSNHDAICSLRPPFAPWGWCLIYDEAFSLRAGSHLLASARTACSHRGCAVRGFIRRVMGESRS